MRSDSYIQWYNENEGRAYPLQEVATKVSDGGHQLPDDIIVDMGLMVPPTYEDTYVSSVRVTSSVVTVGISSSASGLMVGTYLRSAVRPHAAYPLTGLVNNVSGWIVFGNHRAVGTEDYRFSGPEQSGVAARALRIIDEIPVTYFVKLGGRADQIADRLVRMTAGGGLTIERDESDPQKIVIQLSPELRQAFLGPCNELSTADICGVPPMRRINGVCPDEDGRITLRFE